MSQLFEFPQWQEPYLEALKEAGPVKLVVKILKAENAIAQRLRQDLSTVCASRGERRAIRDALSTFRFLQGEESECSSDDLRNLDIA